MEYINKTALVTEIKKLSAYLNSRHVQRLIEKILSIIDTLEVKEVDLEKEIDGYMTKKWEGIEEDKRFYDMMKNNLHDIAKHFFELGLKAQKGK